MSSMRTSGIVGSLPSNSASRSGLSFDLLPARNSLSATEQEYDSNAADTPRTTSGVSGPRRRLQKSVRSGGVGWMALWTPSYTAKAPPTEKRSSATMNGQK